MRYNITKHKLLHQLYLKYKSNLDSTALTEQKQQVAAGKAGLSLSEIDHFLKDKQNDRELILSKLYTNKEIKFFNLETGIGCMIDEDYGINAYLNKKYLNENNDILKNYALLSFLVIGLIIALII